MSTNNRARARTRPRAPEERTKRSSARRPGGARSQEAGSDALVAPVHELDVGLVRADWPELDLRLELREAQRVREDRGQVVRDGVADLNAQRAPRRVAAVADDRREEQVAPKRNDRPFIILRRILSSTARANPKTPKDDAARPPRAAETMRKLASTGARSSRKPPR